MEDKIVKFLVNLENIDKMYYAWVYLRLLLIESAFKSDQIFLSESLLVQ